MSDILKNKSILVVDDNADNREVVVQAMRKMAPEVKVYTAIHGQNALEILAKKNIDLILLDWDMPVLDGLHTLKKLAVDESFKNIPVVMYTGVMTASTDLKEALENGAVDFLRKPADAIELLARIKSILQQKEGEEKRLELERENAQIKQKTLLEKNELLEKELSKNLLLLAQKNEVLGNIKQQCESSIKGNSFSEIKTIIHDIDIKLNSNDYWEEFMHKINQIDQDFLKRLQLAYADLTAGEQRFCALLRCGMDSKSIANLLNITSDSAMKTRYRIRKKMELDNEENLEKVIFGI